MHSLSAACSAEKWRLLERLFEQKKIALKRSALFDAPVETVPEVDADRVEGMLLGLAVGDALGNTSEGFAPAERFSRFGEIRAYPPNRRAGSQPVGLPSDDTQLAFWALEQILEDGCLLPERVAQRFADGNIFGIGTAVRQSRYELWSEKPWYECGPPSAGNGALMRIAPVLLPHLRSPGAPLWTDAALLALVTHNDSASLASCLAFVDLLRRLIFMEEAPPPEWWLKTFLQTLREVETGEVYRPRGGAFLDFEGKLSDYVELTVGEAVKNGWTTLEACEAWTSGGYLLETVPSVLYILMRHGDDLEETIVRAVNDTRDNDTIAAIAGAAAGALHGRKRIPRRWTENLSGRTREDDDGRVFELLGKARRLYA